MKNLVFLFALILFMGCTRIETPKDTIPNTNLTYQVVIVDNCEYIIGTDNGPYNGGYFMAHKGNCKNPIHQHNSK